MPEHLIEHRYQDMEYRADDDGPGFVTGPVITYGDVATFPWGKERFEAGAFGDLAAKT